ncbi:MAG: alpha/beta hydrolase [Bacteroidota bacterium]|nr:alpha/beta hydrolase [Bacteroidota bacterium]
MKNRKPRRKLRIIITWLLWVLLVQFILINISAALYADKLTHLHAATADTWDKPTSQNIFAKTWRLFSGPTFYRQTLSQSPAFAYSPVVLKTHDDISINAWYSRADTLPKGTVILFHGLMGHKGLVMDEAVAFRNLGYNVMMVDVRDHGNSGGNTTTIGYRESEEVSLAYNYVQQAGEKNIFLWGASMGAVEIIKAVSDYGVHPSGIIVEMPFLSLQSHLEGRARILGFPQQPFAFLTTFWIGIERGFNGFGFKITSYAKNIECPVLEQYGEKDELVLKKETDAIYQAIASRNKKLVIYEGAMHESFLKRDPARWKKEVESFLQQFQRPTF